MTYMHYGYHSYIPGHECAISESLTLPLAGGLYRRMAQSPGPERCVRVLTCIWAW